MAHKYKKRTPRPSLDRFMEKILINESGCWIWQGSLKGPNDYANFWTPQGVKLAHKWYWEQLHGPVPEGKELDHTCRTRSCVNPEHLEAVTHLENVQRFWGVVRAALAI